MDRIKELLNFGLPDGVSVEVTECEADYLVDNEKCRVYFIQTDISGDKALNYVLISLLDSFGNNHSYDSKNKVTRCKFSEEKSEKCFSEIDFTEFEEKITKQI